MSSIGQEPAFNYPNDSSPMPLPNTVGLQPKSAKVTNSVENVLASVRCRYPNVKKDRRKRKKERKTQKKT